MRAMSRVSIVALIVAAAALLFGGTCVSRYNKLVTLDQAATDAVKQWVYTPTLLNGVPVPVIMTVTVNFKLS